MWIELDPVRGREQSGRRPALVVASDLYLEQADTLMIIVPATTTDRGWPNHIPVRGPQLGLPRATRLKNNSECDCSGFCFHGTIILGPGLTSALLLDPFVPVNSMALTSLPPSIARRSDLRRVLR